MKYKIGDIVLCKHLVAGTVGRVISTHYSSGMHTYVIAVVHGEDIHYYGIYEEDLELVEAPAQDYLDLFM